MTRALIATAALVIIFAGIKAAASLVVPFLLAVFLTIILSPPFLSLKRRGLPVPVVIVIMIIGLAILSVLTVSILRTSLDQFVASLPVYNAQLRVQLGVITDWLEGMGMDVPDSLVEDLLNPQYAMTYAGSLATALSGMLGIAVIIFIIAAFALVEMSGFDRKLRGLPGISAERVAALEDHLQDLRRYVSLKSVMCVLTGVLVGLFLWLLGIENALFMGLLAFILNYVPAIGSLIAAIPGILLGLIQFGPTMAVVTAIGYIVINVGVSNVIEPRVLGQRLGISPLVVILSLVLWGWLLGPVGMLLSVPLTMMVKVGLESGGEKTRPIAVLLGPPLTETDKRRSTPQGLREPAE